MIDLYKKFQFEDKMSELELIEDRTSNEYFFKYMKIIISFGKEDRLTDYGYKRGEELYAKWKKGEELKREEMMNLGLLLSDICIIDQDYTMQSDITKIYNQTMTKYKPDLAYIQAVSKLFPNLGFTESNPNYMDVVHQMFIKECIEPSPEQMRMVTSGEMPIYTDVKVCPYCNKQFGEANVEDLFKHVKAEHDKK